MNDARFFANPPPGPLLLPSSVMIESCWLLNVRMGATAHAAFLERVSVDIADKKLHLTELAHTYYDARLDPTDVSVIALAERLHVTQVATLDRRDFTIVRPAPLHRFDAASLTRGLRGCDRLHQRAGQFHERTWDAGSPRSLRTPPGRSGGVGAL